MKLYRSFPSGKGENPR